MSFFVGDIESDGPIQGEHSIVCFGLVLVEPSLEMTYYGEMKPLSPAYIPGALAVSGFTREEHEKFPDPETVMKDCAKWIKEVSIGQPILISDNNGYDAAWFNWYFHKFTGSNPFGWSSRRIGDLYCGMMKDSRAQWKHLRKTKHTHNPVDDAKGNAEALLAMKKMGLKIDLR